MIRRVSKGGQGKWKRIERYIAHWGPFSSSKGTLRTTTSKARSPYRWIRVSRSVKILLQRSLIARRTLAKALAAQRGRSLDEEGGFGSGLMAKIEQLHMVRRGLQAEKGRHEAQEPPAEEICEPAVYEPAVTRIL